MKTFNTILVLLFALSYSAFAQSLTLFDIDTSDFPTMRAKFYAFDKDGNQLRPSINELSLTEDGVERTITNVSCPELNPAINISSVLVMDASGSMSEGNPIRLELAKTAATAWINGLPTTRSECAITSFDDENYFIQDFTTNRQLMLNKANSLFAQGGTDYNKALIEPLAGGLMITKSAKYKKVLIMLTDGLPNFEPKVNEIISEANRQNVIIYAVTLNMLCPQNLKDITTQTGGLWFEDITKLEKAKEVYLSILAHSTSNEPCEIEWESSLHCKDELTIAEIKLLSLDLLTQIQYKLPINSIAKLEINPSSLLFLRATKDTCSTITVTANNSDFNISNIIVTNPAYRIEPTNFKLNRGKSKELKVCYTPSDSGYTYCKFIFENALCPTCFYASGGFSGKRLTEKTLKLLHPNGNEVFVVGSDTTITWEGVLPEEIVRIEYSTNNGSNWTTIVDSASGLSYNWIIPNTPSEKCIARVIAKIADNSSNIDMVLIPAGSFQMGNTGSFPHHPSNALVHKVTLSKGFLMSKYEITQELYESVMGINNNPSLYKGDSLPVDNVSWYNAIDFCNKLSELEGLEKCYNGIICDWDANGYRLPTEAEWEYACKAGTTTDLYSGNILDYNSIDLDTNLNKIGWYERNSEGRTHEVGQKEPNSFGIYDMSGNVYEWCWDRYTDYPDSALTDPKGPSSTYSFRVIRGGDRLSASPFCTSSRRRGVDPLKLEYCIGFRICRTY